MVFPEQRAAQQFHRELSKNCPGMSAEADWGDTCLLLVLSLPDPQRVQPLSTHEKKNVVFLEQEGASERDLKPAGG